MIEWEFEPSSDSKICACVHFTTSWPVNATVVLNTQDVPNSVCTVLDTRNKSKESFCPCRAYLLETKDKHIHSATQVPHLFEKESDLGKMELVCFLKFRKQEVYK